MVSYGFLNDEQLLLAIQYLQQNSLLLSSTTCLQYGEYFYEAEGWKHIQTWEMRSPQLEAAFGHLRQIRVVSTRTHHNSSTESSHRDL